MLNAISREEYNELTDGDLVEVAEMHSHGYLVEVIAVSVTTQYTDSGSFDGFTVAAGRIADDCFNVTHIGSGYQFRDDAVYFAFESGDDCEATRNEALAHAFKLFSENAPLPSAV